MNIYDFALSTTWFTQTLIWIAIPATFIFLISTVLIFFGGDADIEADTGLDLDEGPSFSFFTFNNMIAFLMTFAWVTLASIQSGTSEIISIFWGIVSGLLIMVIAILMHILMMKLETKNTPTMITTIGKKGNLINKIAFGGELGKVQIIHNGGLRTYECSAKTPLATHSHVIVTDVINNLLIVELV
jgi:hypothetical protein